MIRVCHVQVLPILSGVQRVMLEIFKHLDRSRFDLHVVCQGSGPLTDELERLDIRWHAMPSLVRPINPRKDWQAYCQLQRLFRQYQFDVVHTHSSKPGILGRVAARRAGVPAVVHHVHAFAFHDFSPPWKTWFYSQLERWAGGFCDRVLFVNHEERQLAIRDGLLPREKCLTVYNGVDLEAFDVGAAQSRAECRRRWRLADDDFAIAFVGRLEYPKQPLLIPAIARHLEALRPNHRWKLLVAGSGADEDQVQELVHRWNLGHRVELLGWQADVRPVFHAADAVILTSLAEGLGLALVEGQAAGRPTVAGDAKGMREVVSPGTGFLCPPKDPGSFAEALARLLDDPQLREQCGRAGRLNAETRFDASKNQRHTAALYEQLLESSAPRLPSSVDRMQQAA